MAQHLSLMVYHYGYLAVFLLMTLESACIPIPSEAVMPYAGYLASGPTHPLSLWGVIVIGTLANLVGGLIIYYVGRFGGRPLILRYGKYVLLSERHLNHAEKWFAKRGEVTVFIGRILPALRTFISLPAGIAEMKVGKFIIFSLLGSLPWNFALTYAGFYLGKNRDVISHYMKPFSYLGAILLVGGVIWFWSVRKRPDTTSGTSSTQDE